IARPPRTGRPCCFGDRMEERMTSLTRRHVLGGAAAIALSGQKAFAQAPVQAGFRALKVGDIEVIVLSDGTRRSKLTASPSRSASLEQFQDALAADGLPRDEIATSFQPVLVKGGGRTMLIDTGNGPRTFEAGTG